MESTFSAPWGENLKIKNLEADHATKNKRECSRKYVRTNIHKKMVRNYNSPVLKVEIPGVTQSQRCHRLGCGTMISLLSKQIPHTSENKLIKETWVLWLLACLCAVQLRE